ncbi:tetratricopeptide repeat protein [Thermobifida halotolerans]|uniref:Tetratricopeptide repeat protein n=2 Tax=Thermobifida halotolerans TaxID=483545 RepID=A0AA97LYR9_9ACTN|nr:tetratricopeptide repeat protein [Thermobifida halotolerans]UOE20476.1 tetratricopeptide repeat protein [Thermobifida halotolerans]
MTGTFQYRDHIDFRDATIHGDAIGVKNEYLPRPATTVWNALPAPPPVFTGREDELAALLQALESSAEESGGVVVSSAAASVAGMGGVGKSALTAMAAHRACQEGWFTRVLWVDLYGYSPGIQALTADRALDVLLRALGVDHKELPATVQEKSALYRSQLAQVAAAQGGPVLVVADNAAGAAQVRPLLPGPGGNRLIVTSRRLLSTLTGVRHLRLDALTPEASLDLLTSLLAAADPDHPHLSDPQGLKRVARLCAGLPLALQIAAGLMVRSTRGTPTRLADQLRGTSPVERLKDEENTLHTVFDLSYEELTPDHARVFVLLGRAPGATISTAAATVLTGLDEDTLIEMLDDLAAAHLITDHPATDRWGMHDLLADYTRTREVSGERDALVRLLDHYTAMTEAANAHLRALPGEETPGTFADRSGATAWLDAEHTTLIDAVRVADRIGHTSAAVNLPLNLAEYLKQRRFFADKVTVNTVARDTARRMGDRHNEAKAWNNLGIALQEMGETDEAIDALDRALACCEETGDRHREASTLNSLGLALHRVPRFEEAITALERARALHIENGNRRGEAIARHSLGEVLRKMGRFEDALDSFRCALALHQELGNRPSEARAVHGIGNVLRDTHRFEEAITALRHALALHRDAGEHHSEATAWHNLSYALRENGQFGESVSALERAVELYAGTGDDYWRATAQDQLDELRREGMSG